MQKLTIYGQVASKKNSKRRTGKYLISSKQYLEWEKEAKRQLQHNFIETIEVSKIKLVFFFKDKRNRDLNNHSQGVLDVLVDLGYIKDDGCFNLPILNLEFGGYDKENPKVEIYIDKLL